MSGHIIINPRAGSYPHLARTSGGLVLVTSGPLVGAQRIALLMHLAEHRAADPGIPGLNEIQDYVMGQGEP